MTHDASLQPRTNDAESNQDDDRVTAEELSAFQQQFRAQAILCSASLDEVADDQFPSSIGRFQILKRIGSGTFGCVYLAYDVRLTRQVAIKVSQLGGHLSGDLRAGFIREAHAAARLAHQNIVCLHEYGEEQGVLYLVYEMCEGPTLADWMAQQTEPISLKIVAALVRDIANGLAHAHLRGLVHRDVKPNNVLLPPNQDESSTLPFTPRVTDFGLAHDFLSMEQKSLSARLVGTIDFMSPEQARGETSGVTPASDQYSLGVILYQLLTGRLPIEGGDFVEHLQRVCREQPRSPRSLRRDVPRDLAAITLTCLQKSPNLRYASCRELARDLDRFLRSTPVHARPLRIDQRIWRAVRAAPIVSTLIGMIVFGCLTSALVFSRLATNLKKQQLELRQTLAELTRSESVAVKARAETEIALEAVTLQKKAAEQHARQAVIQAYRADMHRAYEAWNKRQILETTQILSSISDLVVGTLEPGIDFHLLANTARDAALQMAKHPFPATDVKPIRGTPWVVSADRHGQLSFHHSVTGDLVHSMIVAQGGEINAIDVTSDGKLIAVGGQNSLLGINFVNLYPLQFEDSQSWLADSIALYFSPTVVESLQFSPDSHWLAVGPRYLPVMLYDNQTHQLQNTLASTSRNRTVDFSPNNEFCLVATDDSLRIYDTSNGQLSRSIPCEGTPQLARWSPTGEWLAYATYSDSAVRLTTTSPPYRGCELTQPRGIIESISFSDDGRWLAAGTRRGGVATWSLADIPQDDSPAKIACRSQAVTHSNDVAALCIDQHGRVISASDNGSVVSDHLVSVAATPLGDDEIIAVVDSHDDRAYAIRGLRNGQVVRGEIVLGQVDLESSHELCPSGNSRVSALACDSAQRKVAVGWQDGRVALIDLVSGAIQDYAYDPPEDSLDERQVNCLDFSDDGLCLAVCGDDARVRVWNLSRPEQPLWEHRLTSHAYATCFCGNNRVAVGGMFEHIAILDATVGSVAKRILGAQRVNCLMFDDERQRLVSGHADGRLRVYGENDFGLLHTFNADAGVLSCLTRSSDNSYYFSGDQSGNLKLWNAEQCEFVGNLYISPQQSSITGMHWLSQRQELLMLFKDDKAADETKQFSSGLQLQTFSAH